LKSFRLGNSLDDKNAREDLIKPLKERKNT
jgi:hypothetical protein